MKFRTELKLEKLKTDLTHSSSSVALGSCFVENIGQKLIDLKFDFKINPFGIIFNPYSIAKILNRSIDNPIKLEPECDVLAQNDIYKSFDYHSKFYADSYDDFIQNMNKNFSAINFDLKNGDFLFLTFGTAWVYRLIASNQVVANCHKVPQSEFVKELLDLNELIEIYSKLVNRIVEKNPKLKIVLTVSPVRHIKDGIVENNQSKSVLLLLCKAISDDFKQNVLYFPSYEIQMDDLRDYRFYNQDLIHPNQMAIDYIFEKFSNGFFNELTKSKNKKIAKLIQLENHRFLNATEEQITQHQAKIEALKEQL